ncbi:hypothetical protein V5O48_002360 [Marasmius crinis-equi]|uniref:Uncharacterized protein n=1 Tax=Marasmius crinis-equi TaxID=585013 RepID=A0ABR3FX00_9AGAR
MRTATASTSTSTGPQLPHDHAETIMSAFWSSLLSMPKRAAYIKKRSLVSRRLYSAYESHPEDLRPANVLNIFAASTTAMAAVTLGANRNAEENPQAVATIATIPLTRAHAPNPTPNSDGEDNKDEFYGCKNDSDGSSLRSSSSSEEGYPAELFVESFTKEELIRLLNTFERAL